MRISSSDGSPARFAAAGFLAEVFFAAFFAGLFFATLVFAVAGFLAAVFFAAGFFISGAVSTGSVAVMTGASGAAALVCSDLVFLGTVGLSLSDTDQTLRRGLQADFRKPIA